MDSGLDNFFNQCEEDLLAKFCENLGLHEVSAKKEMVEQLADEVILTGMKAFLTKLSVPILRRYAEEFQLKVPKGTKVRLVEAIMVHIFELEPLDSTHSSSASSASTPTSSTTEATSSENSSVPSENGEADQQNQEKSEKSEESKTDEDDASTKGKPRPPISIIVPGMTSIQLHDTFNLTDLVQYCKEKGIGCYGKKSQIIKRIVKYLETGQVEEKKKRKSKGRSPREAKVRKSEEEKDKETEEEAKEEKQEDGEGQEKEAEQEGVKEESGKKSDD